MNGEAKQICRAGERLREDITEWVLHSKGPVLISALPKNALSDSGSLALTPISAYTFTVPCATVVRERTMRLRARTADSERTYAIVRKSNPLTVFEHPIETPTCYIHTSLPLAALLRGRILHCCHVHLCRDDFMPVNKAAPRKTPIHFSQRERKGYDSVLKPFFHRFTLFC